MNQRSLHFRLATKNDIPAIVTLVNRAYRDETVRGWTSECDIVEGNRTDESEINQLISASGSQLICMFVDHELVGCVQVHTGDDDVYIGMLTIEPAKQSKGLGTRLLEEAEAYASRELARTSISMLVISQRTELMDYYLRRGYERSGELSAYPINRGVGQPKLDGLMLERLVKSLA